MTQIFFPPLDKDVERRRALAKIYSLLIKLAEEKELTLAEANQDKSAPEPLKNNIPSQDRV
jgi:hypothetical protein